MVHSWECSFSDGYVSNTEYTKYASLDVGVSLFGTIPIDVSLEYAVCSAALSRMDPGQRVASRTIAERL